MGNSEIESLVLVEDLENQDNARISRVNEDYVALPGSATSESAELLGSSRQRRSRSAMPVITICCIAAVFFLVGLTFNSWLQSGEGSIRSSVIADENEFYRASYTGYHFQPVKNWMNDPNAPMFYMGYYHFFYQYNPDAATFGVMNWGHAVSKDLIHWTHLELALVPDHWYDIAGVWSGSATILRDGTPAILYTGGRLGVNGEMLQSQCLALPVDPTDPLLLKWKKVDANPIVQNPADISPEDFRDPTTAWLEQDGYWRMTVGARSKEDDGVSLLYKSTDFQQWELQEKYLHQVPGSGMWECPDFYPVSVEDKTGLNYSALQPENYVDTYRYVMKASLAAKTQDYYTIGTYSTETDIFTADDPALDLGRGPRYDYGKFYASKTFYDSSTGRRILWGWASESDSEQDDITKGWASVQTIPRTVWLDDMTSKNLLQWPVVEVEALRGAKESLQNVELLPTDVVKVQGGDGPQLDIEVVFEKPDVSNLGEDPDEEDFDCSQGSAYRGTIGPFGLLVHTDDALTEQTGVFFYVSPLEDGRWATRVCSDQSKSSLATGLDKTVYGSYVTVLPTENELSLRVLVDHSIVETYVQGGRLAITSRVYPTVAIGSNSHLFLFNNGTTPIVVKSLDVYQMKNATMAIL